MAHPVRKAAHLHNRTFGLVFSIFFGIIAAIGFVFFGNVLAWAIAVSLCFLVAALVLPGMLLPLNRFWDALARRLSVVSNFMVLGLIYFAVLTPTAVVMRVFGRDAMKVRAGAAQRTYFTAVSRKVTPETLRDLF